MEKLSSNSVGKRKYNLNVERKNYAGKTLSSPPNPADSDAPAAMTASAKSTSSSSKSRSNKTSSASPSPPASDISVQLWLKSDVFTFGALQVPPHNRIVFENLKKLVNYAFVKNQTEFPQLRFPTWRHVACDKLGMAPEVAWIYFETYDMLRDLAVPQLGKIFDVEALGAASSSKDVFNGGCGEVERRGDPPVEGVDPKDEVWVDVRRFALLLGIQRIHKISLRSSATMGDEWPSSGQPPSSPRPQPPHASSRSSSVHDAEACLAFFLTYLNDFIDLLLTPISTASTTTSSGAASARSPSVPPTALTLEAVESLGFLVGVKLSDRELGTETLLNLHNVATIPGLHAVAGYDPLTKTFDYRLFEDWLRASLVPDPYAFPVVSASGSHLPWILPSTHDASTVGARASSASSSTSTRTTASPQIVSNLNLGPRPREKIVHLSGVVKETVARSDDDEFLFQSSVNIHRSRDSSFYLLAPVRTALISKCRNVVVVLGCVETTVHVNACENLTLIVCCRRLSVAVSKRCVFHLLTPCSPLVLGYNESLTFAPYHTSYPELSRHLDLCNVGTAVNRWNRPYVMGAATADAETKSWRLLDPADFSTFAIPFVKPSREKSGNEGSNASSLAPRSRLEIPGGLPIEYKAALDANVERFVELREKLAAPDSPPSMQSARQINDFNRVVRGRFLDWMMTTGCHKELRALAKLDVTSNYDVEN